MSLEIKSEAAGNSAHIFLVGELDGSTAPKLRTTVDEMLSKSPANLVLHLESLTFMASAALRVLIFAKQKSPDLKIYVVKPQEAILETLHKTGFYQGVYVVDEAPAELS